MTKDQTRHQEKDEALLRVDDLLGELRDKQNIQSLCVLVIGAGLNDNKFGFFSCLFSLLLATESQTNQ